MREILFRGKRVDNGEWVIGNRLFDNVSGKHYIVPFGNITESDKIGQEGCCYCVGFEVIPETIGEFTDLTDKNGRKIFEGDILSFFNSDGEYTNYEVLWFGNRWSVVMCGTNSADDLDILFCEQSDIIGNIQDNSELLEQES